MFPGLVERRWQEAVRQGDMAGLRGAGRPLPWDEESLVPPEWRLAFHLLKTSGLAPAWIELDREIRLALEAALDDLTAAYAQPSSGEPTRREARERFSLQVAEINQRIRRLNLAVPHDMFTRCTVSAAGCIAAVTNRPGAQDVPLRPDPAPRRAEAADAAPSPRESRAE